MGNPISGGSFLVARKIFHSDIWAKPPLYFKVFIWILGRASHSDHEKAGYVYSRGTLTTTSREIAKACEYRLNRQHIITTSKQIRVILEWLRTEEMINFEPILQGQTTGADTGANIQELTGAYIGIKIVVINYDAYQTLESYRGRPQTGNKGSHLGRPRGHDNNNGVYKNGLKETSTDCDHKIKFEEFWKTYPARNGRKVGKKISFEYFCKIPENEIEGLLLATANYTAEVDPKYAKDPERFLKNDFWKDWIKKELPDPDDDLDPMEIEYRRKYGKQLA